MTLRICHREKTYLVTSVNIKTCFEMTFEVINFAFNEWTVLFCHQVETDTGSPDSQEGLSLSPMIFAVPKREQSRRTKVT